MTYQTLSEVTTFISRGISPVYDDFGYMVINQRCIRENCLLFEKTRKTSVNKTRIRQEKYLLKWDILVNSTGVGTLGRVAQLKEDLSNATVDSHVSIVRPNLDLVDGAYLGYAVIAQEEFIESLGEGATGQTELSRERLWRSKSTNPINSRTKTNCFYTFCL